MSAAAPDTLVVKGSVVTAGGSPASNVQIYAANLADALGATGSDGTYEITLDHETLAQLGAGNSNFRLFFEKSDDPNAKAVSADTATGIERGERLFGPVTLQMAGTISGKVLQVLTGQEPAPAQGATITFGRASTTTGADGTFTLTGVPAANLPITVTAPKLATETVPLTLGAGDTKALDRPIVLFPESGIVGAVIADPVMKTDPTTAVNHPYAHAFKAYCSKNGKFMRYAGDPILLGTAPWHDIPENFVFDFLKDGGNTLFYQFADEKLAAFSPIQSIVVVIDRFADATGVVVGDGSGYAMKRDIILHFNVPEAAYRMHIAESLADLAISMWMLPLPTMAYTLALPRDPLTGFQQGYGERILFVQYMDAMGLLSPIFQTPLVVDMFPPITNHVFTINNGAPISTDRLVRLDIQIPVSAYEMRVFEAQTESGGGGTSLFGSTSGGSSQTRNTRELWLPVQSYLFYTVANPGLKTLYLQFRTQDLTIVSPVYQETIRVDPFPPANYGFLVNGGAPSSPDQNLQIALIPPPTAVEFRIFEISAGSSGGFGTTPGSSAPWLTIVPSFAYKAEGAGLRSIYLQYRTIDQDESTTFLQNIFVESFPPPVGGFTINGGAIATILPNLLLTIAPPPDAYQMTVWEGAYERFDKVWTDVRPDFAFPILGAGPHVIQVQFKNIDGTLSPALQQTIFYDPFPLGQNTLVINNGDEKTTDTNVTLSFHTLGNITSYRVADNPNDLAIKPFLELTPTVTYQIPADAGAHRVYVQFSTPLAELSPVYFDEITKE